MTPIQLEAVRLELARRDAYRHRSKTEETRLQKECTRLLDALDQAQRNEVYDHLKHYYDL